MSKSKRRPYLRVPALIRLGDGSFLTGKAHPVKKGILRIDYSELVTHTFDPKTGRMLCCPVSEDVFLGYTKKLSKKS